MKNSILQRADSEKSEGNTLSNKDLKRIKSLYKESLLFPTHKNKLQILICPIGLVGAGKTTVIKPICKKLNLLRISSDEIRKLLHKEGFNYKRTIEIAYEISSEYINKGASLALDGDSISPQVRKKINESAKNKNIHIFWIHINPPRKFIIQKLKAYKHTWLFKDAKEAIANYNRRIPLHSKYLSSLKFYFTFDPSKANIKNQINEFVTKVKNDYQL